MHIWHSTKRSYDHSKIAIFVNTYAEQMTQIYTSDFKPSYFGQINVVRSKILAVGT